MPALWLRNDPLSVASKEQLSKSQRLEEKWVLRSFKEKVCPKEKLKFPRFLLSQMKAIVFIYPSNTLCKIEEYPLDILQICVRHIQ